MKPKPEFDHMTMIKRVENLGRGNMRCLSNTKGENHRQASLLNCQAVEIVKLVANGIDPAEVAALFGVSKKTVHQVYTGVRYSDATFEERRKWRTRTAT